MSNFQERTLFNNGKDDEGEGDEEKIELKKQSNDFKIGKF